MSDLSLQPAETAHPAASPMAALMTRTEAVLDGHFLLSSGLHSDRYLQCARLLQHPELAGQAGSDLAAALQKCAAPNGARNVDAVIGPALGGIVIAHEVARALGVRCIFAERESGTLTLRRGFALEPGERVFIVEDVVTTGLSARETAALVESRGAHVLAFGAVVERTADHGLAPFASLWQVRPRLFSSGACPLCAAGEPLYKPGSRTVAR